MSSRRDQAEQPPPTSVGDDADRLVTGSGISRRALFRYGSGTAVIAGVGVAGLLDLLQNREALAAGIQIGLHGITREPDEPEETPHRHTFSAVFQVTSITPEAIMGDVSGHTGRVISTGSEREDQHFHLIRANDVALEALISSGPEDDEPGQHSHPLSLE
ncbi:MAG TPA: hypothetical protein VFA43_11900 [Gemmatimonadaceae bacterium]|nr:hypothetical protein [Gemmatimonadaceae bacterium]